MARKKNNPKRSAITKNQDPPSDATKSTPEKQILLAKTSSKRASAKAKQDSSGQAIKGPKDMAAQTHAEDSLNRSTKGLNLNKRSRPDNEDDDDDEALDNVGKRPKINSNAGLDHRSTQPEDVPAQQPPTSAITTQVSTAGSIITTHSSTTGPVTAANRATAALPIPALPLSIPAEVQHLQEKYDFSTLSILSSAKIELKVRNVLYRIGKFTFADIKAKPGVMILHAQVNVASKMVSIVEIAKQQIEKEKGRWWQYSKLHSEIKPLKVKQPKKVGEGKTLAEWAAENSSTHGTGKNNDTAETAEETMDTAELGQKEKNDVVREDDDMEETFEIMGAPKKGAIGLPHVEEGNKVRAVPVMTIYLARVPVPGLKELYG